MIGYLDIFQQKNLFLWKYNWKIKRNPEIKKKSKEKGDKFFKKEHIYRSFNFYRIDHDVPSDAQNTRPFNWHSKQKISQMSSIYRNLKSFLKDAFMNHKKKKKMIERFFLRPYVTKIYQEQKKIGTSRNKNNKKRRDILNNHFYLSTDLYSGSTKLPKKHFLQKVNYSAISLYLASISLITKHFRGIIP